MFICSFTDYTGRNLSDCAIEGDIIESSCFSQEMPDSHIFPEKMKGVTFRRCNLDNVYIPPGNTVENCSQRRFKAQDDGEDWLVDENNKPLSLLSGDK